MALTQVYVDPALNGNVGSGTISDPYGDLQYALNTQPRDAVNGDQFNIKAGTAEVLTAALSYAVYGTPTLTAPLVFRGYTAAANDGGKGQINTNGFGMSAPAYSAFIDLIGWNVPNYISVFGVSGMGLFLRCEAHTGAGSLSYGFVGRAGSVYAQCYAHDIGAGIATGYSHGHRMLYNYCRNCTTAGIRSPDGASDTILGNIIVCQGATQEGIFTGPAAYGQLIAHNIVYNTVAGTGAGINCDSTTTGGWQHIRNNIVCGFSGAGGAGIRAVKLLAELGYNAFWNNTSNYSAANGAMVDERANDVLLAADPFVNAAGGNFALTDVAKALLRSAGWLDSYLGAATDPHITIGAVQYGEAVAAGGGGPIVGSRIIRGLGAV